VRRVAGAPSPRHVINVLPRHRAVPLEAFADVHAKDDFGCTALHEAGGSGRAEAVEALLAAGADVRAKNDFGWTALHEAGRSGRAEVVDTLLEAGADVHANPTGKVCWISSFFGPGIPEKARSGGLEVHFGRKQRPFD